MSLDPKAPPARLTLAGLGDRLGFGALLAFVVCTYTTVAIWIPATAPLRPALASSALAAFGALLWLVAAPARLQLDGGRGFALAALCGLAALSVSWSLDPQLSREASLELAKEGLIYLVMVQLLRSPARLRAVAAALTLAALVPALGTLDHSLRGLDLLGGTRARWIGIFQDPNHLAMALVSVFPLALLFAFDASRVAVRALFGGAVAALASAVVVTQSRGAALGLGVATLAFALTRRRKRHGLTAIALVAAGLLTFAPAAFWSRTETLVDYRTDVSAQGRAHAWLVLYRLAVDRPFSGAGAGAFLKAWPLYAPIEAGPHAFVTHNVFLQPLAELGLGGFLAFLALVSACLAGAFAARSASGVGSLAGALFASLLGNLVCQLSSGYSPNTFLFMLLGLAAATDRAARREAPALSGGPSPWPTPLFA